MRGPHMAQSVRSVGSTRCDKLSHSLPRRTAPVFSTGLCTQPRCLLRRSSATSTSTSTGPRRLPWSTCAGASASPRLASAPKWKCASAHTDSAWLRQPLGPRRHPRALRPPFRSRHYSPPRRLSNQRRPHLLPAPRPRPLSRPLPHLSPAPLASLPTPAPLRPTRCYHSTRQCQPTPAPSRPSLRRFPPPHCCWQHRRARGSPSPPLCYR